jgi:hypothetical protein
MPETLDAPNSNAGVFHMFVRVLRWIADVAGSNVTAQWTPDRDLR